MDLDLWGSPYDPVAEDSSLCTPLEWQFEFYYDYRFDVIEEDTLKEKCCIQVLRILITKADTEIDELEQDLILLQSELAWIENEEWSEIGSNALIEKINCLAISLKSLINKDKDDVEVHLLMHTQPIERLNEILKALLSNYICNKDAQPANADIKDSRCLKLASGFSDVEIRYSCPKNKQKGKSKNHGFSPKDQRVMQNSSSNSADKGKCSWEEIKIQLTNVGVNSAISDAWKHADDSSIKMKILSKSGSTVVSEEFEEHSSVSTAGVVLDSSANPGEKVKHLDFSKNIAAEELSCATGLSERNGNVNSGLGPFSNPDDRKKLIDFTLNAATKQSMKELTVAASKKVVSSNSSVKAEEKERDLLQIAKVVEAALTETESSALTLLLEQQDKKGQNAIKLRPKEELKTMPKDEMSEIAADEKKFNLNMSLNSLKQKTKRSINLNPPILHEAGFSTVMGDSSSSPVTKANKRKKSVLSSPIASLNEEWKTIVQLGKCESEEYSPSPDEIPDSVLQSLKKTEFLKSPFISNFKDLPRPVEYSEAAAPVPYSSLKKMKLAELQHLAKKHGLTKYSKLSKEALLQLIAESIGVC